MPIALLIAAIIAAETPPPVEAAPARVAVVGPEWEEVPDAEAMDAFYPYRARKDGVEGQVVLRCTIDPARRLSDCAIESETPAGQGFGLAARLLSTKFKARAVVDGRSPVGRVVQVPIAFEMPEPPTPDAVAFAARCSGLLIARWREKPVVTLEGAAAVAFMASEDAAKAGKTPDADIKRWREEGRADRSESAYTVCWRAYGGGPIPQ